MGHLRKNLVALAAVATAWAAFLIGPNAFGCDSQSARGYVSPGLLLSFAFNRTTSFGLGAEVSYNRLLICETRSSDVSGFPTGGYGAFLNGVYYLGSVNYTRLAGGGQANAFLLGGEAGVGYVSGMRGADETGSAVGPYLGAFVSGGYVMLALRGTFATFGDERHGTFSLDLGIKAPIRVDSR